MEQEYFSQHWTDKDGNPTGGTSCGMGFSISWQNGPLGRGDDRQEPNGAFVETLIQAIKGRLHFYQESKFACHGNASAIDHLERALEELPSRTRDRDQRGVEGTHSE